MNVILDIDETFVQYVGIDDWNAVSEAEREKYQTGGETTEGLFILRPYFDEFFTFLFESCKTVNLWTWSDKDYADSVRRIIESRNPKWKLTNIWYDEDVDKSIDMNGHNKDLNYIWYVKGVFQPCDTILVDDLPENTQNPSNIKNGIQILPFAPLGHKLKTKTPKKLRSGPYKDMSKDDTLLRVKDVIQKAMDSVEFCSEGDLPHPFEKTIKIGGRRRKTFRRKNRRTTRKYRR
jgi:hypothetical protein